MCGRYLLDTDIEELEEIYRIVNRGQLDHIHNGLVYPTNTVPVIVCPEGQRKMDLMGWGYEISHVKGPIINTRWEKLIEKKAVGSFFTEALAHRRCIIPATAYYEWRTVNGDKRPFTIKAESFERGAPQLAMAGVYYKALDSTWRFAIVTRPPTEQIAAIHDRMPLLLSSEETTQWLDHRLDEKNFYQWDLMTQSKIVDQKPSQILAIKEGICDAYGHLIEPLKPEQLRFEF